MCHSNFKTIFEKILQMVQLHYPYLQSCLLTHEPIYNWVKILKSKTTVTMSVGNYNDAEILCNKILLQWLRWTKDHLPCLSSIVLRSLLPGLRSHMITTTAISRPRKNSEATPIPTLAPRLSSDVSGFSVKYCLKYINSSQLLM